LRNASEIRLVSADAEEWWPVHVTCSAHERHALVREVFAAHLMPAMRGGLYSPVTHCYPFAGLAAGCEGKMLKRGRTRTKGRTKRVRIIKEARRIRLDGEPWYARAARSVGITARGEPRRVATGPNALPP